MMQRRILMLTVAAMIATFFVCGTALAASGDLQIACEGWESTGGGANIYQYTLINNGVVPNTLTRFYLGTMDGNIANYSNWVAPAGFAPVPLILDWTTAVNQYGLSVMYTTQTKTPHGGTLPAQSVPSAWAILWTGSVIVNPGTTVTFGFDNFHESWDMEWFAEHPAPANSSQAFMTAPVAGPLGVFTQGYVHAPGTEPLPVMPTTFGRIKQLYGS